MLGAGHRFGTRDGLLLMPGTAAEHGIKPKADEQSDHGKQDNLNRHANFSNKSPPYISAAGRSFKCNGGAADMLRGRGAPATRRSRGNRSRAGQTSLRFRR
jgi:hypothetical protein